MLLPRPVRGERVGVRGDSNALDEKDTSVAKHRLAVIGVGLASTPHLESLAELSARVEVVWAVARSQRRLPHITEKYGYPTTTDIDRVVHDPSIECALVLTPPDTHHALVERLAAAGKHILLEKPLALDLASSQALVNTCATRGVRLGVVFQYRFRLAAVALGELVASGDLGELASASVAVRWWRPQSYYDQPGRGTYARDGGGVLMTQAIHALDLYLSLTGEPAEVSAFAATTALHRMEAEDLVAAALRFPNGALGVIDATTASYPGFPEHIELVGTRATAVYTAGRLDIHYQDGRTQTIGANETSGAGALPMAFSHAGHKALIVDFLDSLEQGREPRASGRTSLHVHRLIDALIESSRSGSTVRLATGG
jgi:UDP-N-acetyl-2-amino-2-deoxyglucuronate dehydrogenase